MVRHADHAPPDGDVTIWNTLRGKWQGVLPGGPREPLAALGRASARLSPSRGPTPHPRRSLHTLPGESVRVARPGHALAARSSGPSCAPAREDASGRAESLWDCLAPDRRAARRLHGYDGQGSAHLPEVGGRRGARVHADRVVRVVLRVARVWTWCPDTREGTRFPPHPRSCSARVMDHGTPGSPACAGGRSARCGSSTGPRPSSSIVSTPRPRRRTRPATRTHTARTPRRGA